ncbi:MAG TPA: SRPBCC family protein [Mycobacteriales bacterium]|nr:SRPBCC family protein [Mycobacteriales bacterium]
MIRGEGSAFIAGVTAQDIFDFVLDPAQYTKADLKVVGVTKLADTDDGMIAREDGKFLGKFPGSVITRYRWMPPYSIDVVLEHGVPAYMHAWFEIEDRDGGAFVRHVEELAMRKPFSKVWDLMTKSWFAKSVAVEVAEIARLMEAGDRGRGIAAH